MATFPVEIVQTYRVERRIIVDVEADDLQAALDKQAEEAAPDYDDKGWIESCDLQNEDVSAG